MSKTAMLKKVDLSNERWEVFGCNPAMMEIIVHLPKYGQFGRVVVDDYQKILDVESGDFLGWDDPTFPTSEVIRDKGVAWHLLQGGQLEEVPQGEDIYE